MLDVFLALFRARKPANNRFDHYLYFPSWLVVKVQSFCYVNLMMTTGSKNFKRMKLSCSSPKETPKRPTFQFPELLTRFIFLNCFFQAFFGLEKMIRALGLPDNKLTKVPVDSLEILSLLTRQ